jgi:hypothetical protein
MTCDPVPLRYLKASLPGEDVAAGSVRRVTVDSAVGTADSVAGTAMAIDLLQKTSLNGEQEYKKRCAT